MKLGIRKTAVQRSQDELRTFTERMKALSAPERRGELELLRAQLDTTLTNPGLHGLARVAEGLEVFGGGISALALMRARIRILEELIGERHAE